MGIFDENVSQIERWQTGAGRLERGGKQAAAEDPEAPVRLRGQKGVAAGEAKQESKSGSCQGKYCCSQVSGENHSFRSDDPSSPNVLNIQIDLKQQEKGDVAAFKVDNKQVIGSM